MYCSKCGKEITAGSNFCGYCGQAFNTTNDFAQSELAQGEHTIKQEQFSSVAKCSKCGSTSLIGNKKGFGIGKALIGACVIGPIGLVAGNFRAKKVVVTCMNCGHQFLTGGKVK